MIFPGALLSQPDRYARNTDWGSGTCFQPERVLLRAGGNGAGAKWQAVWN
jgi:hypothetical protein